MCCANARRRDACKLRATNVTKRYAQVTVAIGLIVGLATPVSAFTLRDALEAAYSNNPTLNAARAQVRVTDENVPIAKSAGRPQVFGDISGGLNRYFPSAGGPRYNNTQSFGITAQQNIFRGYRTENSIKQAKSSIKAERENLRSTEQDVLLDAVTAFMNVIRDTAIVNLRRSDLEFLTQQVQAARDRFDVGEGTRTDVSQAEARRAAAQSELNLAMANVNASRAVFQQIIGVKPKGLVARDTINRTGLPKSMEAAVDSGLNGHPVILAAMYNVDAARYNAQVIEGELLPTVSIEGGVNRTYNHGNLTSTSARIDSAQILGRVTIPIYQGGNVSSRVRQAKEQLGVAQLQGDVARDQVRAAAINAWGQYQAAEASIIAARAQVAASQIALNGVLEEQKVGQRTTLDVLDSQRELVNARVSLVGAERDRVVAAYALMSAAGRLTASSLGLSVRVYQPVEHYEKVKDKWFGLRTPDGR